MIWVSSISGFAQCDGWTQRANFVGPARYGMVSFAIGTKGYVGTGYSGSYHKDFWEYDQSTDTWAQKANFGGSVRSYAVGFSIGGKGYVGTGGTIVSLKTDFWEYDPLSNSWTKKADFGGVPRTRAVGFAVGNRGYIGTGIGNPWPTAYQDFWEYDPANDIWIQKSNLGGAARQFAAGFSIGDKGFIGTGISVTGSVFKDFWEYDTAGTGTWIQIADLGGVGRYNAVVFSINGKGYIGTGENNFGAYLNDFWEYDTTGGNWTKKADFGGTSRVGSFGLSIGNKGYIGTGYDGGLKQDFWEYLLVMEASAGGEACFSNDSIVIGGLPTAIGGNGSYTYSWSPTQGLGDSTIANPLAAPLINTTYTVIATDSNGCTANDSIIVRVSPSFSTTSSITHVSCASGNNGAIDLSASGGSPPYTYLWSSGDTTEDIVGLIADMYGVLIADTNGCSIIDSMLVSQPVPILNSTLVQICDFDSAFIHGAYRNIDETFSDTLLAQNGCDSIIDTVLVVNTVYTITDSAMLICNGDSAMVYGTYRSVTGIYFDSLTSVDGCDSIRSTVLSVSPTYAISDSALTICNGDSSLIYGTYRTTSGIFYDSLTTVDGCDSVHSTVLSVNSTYTISDTAIIICPGDSSLIYGTYRAIAATYFDGLTTVDGCDSIHSTLLTVNSTYTIIDSAISICDGDSSLIYGMYRTTAGIFFDSLTTVVGCDSIHSTLLTVNPTYTIIDSAISICDGDSSLIYGMYQTTAGIFFDSLTTVVGCDSIHSTILSVNPTYTISDPPIAICDGDSSLIYGTYRTGAGTYFDSLTTLAGCDSIHSAVLSVNPTYTIIDSAISICDGDSSLIYGMYRTTAGIFFDSLTTVVGCDSVHSTILSVNPAYTISDSALTICNGDSSLIYGTYRTTIGMYFDSLTTLAGCDSIHSTVLSVNPTYTISDTAIIICPGDSSLIYGTYRTIAATYFDSLTTLAGCDSIKITELTVDQLPSVSFTGLDSFYCTTDAGVIMAGTPIGGTFSGTGGIAGNQFFPATGVNTYIVTYSYTDSLGCSSSDSQSVSVVQCTGIVEEDGLSQIVIYPNPNTGEFTISVNTERDQHIELKVFNNLGELVSAEKVELTKGLHEKRVDLRGRAVGIYNIQIIFAGGAINRIVIIE